MTIPSTFKKVLVLGVLLFAINSTGMAQSSVKVSLSHPSVYDAISALQSRGHVVELTPDRLPYSIGEIKTALQRMDRSELMEVERYWLERLESDLDELSPRQKISGKDALHLQLSSGVEFTNTRRRDVYRPLAYSTHTWPFAHAAGTFSKENWSVHTRVRFDYYYDSDPDGLDAVNRLYSRNEESYLGYQDEKISFYVGRIENHWGVYEEPAGLLSTNPRTFDQVQFTLGGSTLSFTLLYGMLDGMNGDSTFTGETRFDQVSFNRFLALKRIDWRVSDALRLSFREGIIHSGRNAVPDFRYLMPGSFYFFSEAAAPYDDQQNLLMGFSGWYQKKGWTLHSEFVLDDLIFNRKKRGLNEKSNFAYSFMARYAIPQKPADLSLRTHIASYQVYNTDYPETRYLYLGRGLASQNTDFIHTELRVNFYGTGRWKGWKVTPYTGILHQGEQKINQPFAPKRDSGVILPLVVTGVPEKTVRSAVSLQFTGSKIFWMNADVGLNSIRNQDHQTGDSGFRFTGLLRLGIELDALLTVNAN